MAGGEGTSAEALQDCTNQASTPVQSSDEGPPDAKRKKLRVMGVSLNYNEVNIFVVLE